jgi:hypothetical protein
VTLYVGVACVDKEIGYPTETDTGGRCDVITIQKISVDYSSDLLAMFIDYLLNLIAFGIR